MDNGEGANGGPYASSSGRSILGHKKGNLNQYQGPTNLIGTSISYPTQLSVQPCKATALSTVSRWIAKVP